MRYAEMGHHRTGSPADLATLDWIQAELLEAGARVQRHDYPTENFFLEDTDLVIDGIPYTSFPLWFPVATPSRKTAALCDGANPETWPGRVPVFVLEGLEGLRQMRALPARLEAAGAAGAILVTRTAPGSFYADNSGRTCTIPVLIVGSRDEDAIVRAAQAGASVDFGISGASQGTSSSVILGEFGAETGPAIYISTPVSAFTQAAGERGCGIALFLGLARSLTRNTKKRFIFLAESGHEIDSPGLRAYMKSQAPPASSVSAWLHLGANIATFEFERVGSTLIRKEQHQSGIRLLTNRMELRERAAAALSGSPFNPQVSGASFGTTGFYMSFDYPVIGFEGGAAHHHTPDDGPNVTSPALLEETAGWLKKLVSTL
jgi:hypothetical protein